MTLLILALASVVSLFFSLIFSTTLFQRKAWSLIYVSLSLLFLSLTSISLFVGQLFAWYTWMTSLFIISYVWISPTLFGLVWSQAVKLALPKFSRYAILGYGLVIGTLMVWFTWETLQKNRIDLVQHSVLTLKGIPEESLLFTWIVGVFLILLIISSLFLWLRKLGIAWLWVSISGAILYFLDRILIAQGLHLIFIGILLLICSVLIYQAASGIVKEKT